MAGERILYVEDDPDIRLVAQLAMEVVGGLSVCTCTCGEEALAKAPEFSPDLLLLDVMMPGLDGPETLRGLRSIPGYAEIPAVFMTAKARSEEVASLRAAGAIAVIAKPFDPMNLALQLTELMQEAAKELRRESDS